MYCHGGLLLRALMSWVAALLARWHISATGPRRGCGCRHYPVRDLGHGGEPDLPVLSDLFDQRDRGAEALRPRPGTGRARVTGPAVHAHPVTNRCEETLARFRVRTEPCRIPSGYWDPGFTTMVRPSLLVARDSWMWPHSATTGCTSSMDSRMA